jgi:23S rRNA maturation mini-RNase III
MVGLTGKMLHLWLEQLTSGFVISQEMYYELLSATPFLTNDERDVLRWGRNAKVSVPKRFTAVKNGEVYRKATAIECLVSSAGLEWRRHDGN